MSSTTNKNCTTCLYEPDWGVEGSTTEFYGLCKWPRPVWLAFHFGGAVMWKEFQKDQEDFKCPTWTPRSPTMPDDDNYEGIDKDFDARVEEFLDTERCPHCGYFRNAIPGDFDAYAQANCPKEKEHKR